MSTAVKTDTAASVVERLAIDALLREVETTPKPGLVDRANPGAHADMDIGTFYASVTALRGYFGGCFGVGRQTRARPHSETLRRLQALGKTAEKSMYAATAGVNTHKGAIFSLGILCGAAGRLYGQPRAGEAQVRREAACICKGLMRSAFAGIHKKPPEELTKGERMFALYGMPGARGEVESGFATVASISLPVFSRLMNNAVPLNDAMVETLLHLIAYTEDTNIVSRHDCATAAYARHTAKTCLKQGGFLQAGGATRVDAMDAAFIRQNISPGGSADLLAVTYFLYGIGGLLE